MDKLREELEKYKAITLQLIGCLKAEEYDMLNELLDKRKCIICEMDKIGCEAAEFKYICKELELPVLEDRLNDSMADSYKMTKDNLKNVIKGKNINKSYRPERNKDSYVDSIFLSKKI